MTRSDGAAENQAFENRAILEEEIGKLGFALWGVCDAAPSDRLEFFDQWLEDGKHGEMAYLADHTQARRDPSSMLAGARSCVMVADLYATGSDTGEDPEAEMDIGGKAVGIVARYARGRDYHKTIKKRLHELADAMRARIAGSQYRSFVDTAPVPEREYAARAGLAWTGKHTLGINPKLGSYLLLGGMFTDAEFSQRDSQQPIADHCGTCTRCIDACPTGAITAYSVDARRCISYLTIEHRSVIDAEFHEPMRDWLAGCDVCQDVCPHNRPRLSASAPGIHASYAPRLRGFDALEVLGWTEADRRAGFQGSALKRISLDMIRRNALIVAGNALRQRHDQHLLDRVRSIASDMTEPELTRQTASDVLAGLTRG